MPVTLAGFREASPSKIEPSCSISAQLPASDQTGLTAPCPCVGICTGVKWLNPGSGELPCLLCLGMSVDGSCISVTGASNSLVPNVVKIGDVCVFSSPKGIC